MAHEMIVMSTKLKQANVGDLVQAVKKISHIKDIKSFMTFPKLDKTKELKVVVFTDASLGNINEGTGSTGAYIIWLMLSDSMECEENKKSSTINFSCRDAQLRRRS